MAKEFAFGDEKAALFTSFAKHSLEGSSGKDTQYLIVNAKRVLNEVCDATVADRVSHSIIDTALQIAEEAMDAYLRESKYHG